jgi:hypothetical protein
VNVRGRLVDDDPMHASIMKHNRLFDEEQKENSIEDQKEETKDMVLESA